MQPQPIGNPPLPPSRTRLLEQARRLASLPEVVTRIIDMIHDGTTSARDIGAVIAEDPALTARLLRIVNSPFYGLVRKVDTLSRAITVIGTLELVDLVLAASIVRSFRGIPPEQLDMRAFWHHSLLTGTLARALARSLQAPGTERYFIMGLLHDIGALLLCQGAGSFYAGLRARAADTEVALADLERESLGFDHGELGADLLADWHLPESVTAAVRCHHQPRQAEDHPFETAVVHVADALATTWLEGEAAIELRPELDGDQWALLHLSVTELDDCLDRALADFAAVRSALLG